ncbi:MAG: hypothetical protein U0790_26655 [Isosphaeraceae bacterium]
MFLKTARRIVVPLIALAFGYCLGGMAGPRAVAQPGLPPPSGRYQVSAWALPPTEGEAQRRVGCYMVDSATGELWRLEQQAGGSEWTKVPSRPKN